MNKKKDEPTLFEPRSERDAEIARLLGSQYRFIRFLGDGSQSSVFAVLNKSLDRIEALKVLSDNLTRQKDFLNRFKVEAKIIASLTHKNIVTIYDYKKLKEFYYFTMFYVDGPKLTQFIDPLNPMPINDACTNIATVCKAIDYAHNKGVIHRDLKASNILIDKSGKPYISDFGIAKWEKALNQTQSGMVMGSPHYVSPEQAAGRKIDVRSDIYSLGVTLYVLLTQHYPFKGDTSHLTIAQRLTQQPVPPQKIRPDLPRRVVGIINKSLQKNRRHRYQSAADMAEDLTDFVQSAKRAERRPKAIELPFKAKPMNNKVVTTFALVVLALAIPILLFLTGHDTGSSDQQHRPPAQKQPHSDGSWTPIKSQVHTDTDKEKIENNNKAMLQAGEKKNPNTNKITADHKKRKQQLNTWVAKINRQFNKGAYDACLRSVKSTISIIESYDKAHQKQFAGLKAKVVSYREKAVRAKTIEDQKRSITEEVKRKIAKGKYESAIQMVDAMLKKTELAPEVKKILSEHRKVLEMLVNENG